MKEKLDFSATLDSTKLTDDAIILHILGNCDNKDYILKLLINIPYFSAAYQIIATGQPLEEEAIKAVKEYLLKTLTDENHSIRKELMIDIRGREPKEDAGPSEIYYTEGQIAGRLRIILKNYFAGDNRTLEIKDPKAFKVAKLVVASKLIEGYIKILKGIITLPGYLPQIVIERDKRFEQNSPADVHIRILHEKYELTEALRNNFSKDGASFVSEIKKNKEGAFFLAIVFSNDLEKNIKNTLEKLKERARIILENSTNNFRIALSTLRQLNQTKATIPGTFDSEYFSNDSLLLIKIPEKPFLELVDEYGFSETTFIYDQTAHGLAVDINSLNLLTRMILYSAYKQKVVEHLAALTAVQVENILIHLVKYLEENHSYNFNDIKNIVGKALMDAKSSIRRDDRIQNLVRLRDKIEEYARLSNLKINSKELAYNILINNEAPYLHKTDYVVMIRSDVSFIDFTMLLKDLQSLKPASVFWEIQASYLKIPYDSISEGKLDELIQTQRKKQAKTFPDKPVNTTATQPEQIDLMGNSNLKKANLSSARIIENPIKTENYSTTSPETMGSTRRMGRSMEEPSNRSAAGNFENNARGAQTPMPGRRAQAARHGAPQPPNRGGQGQPPAQNSQNNFQNNARRPQPPIPDTRVPSAGGGAPQPPNRGGQGQPTAQNPQNNFQNNARSAQTPMPDRRAQTAGGGAPQPPNRGGQGRPPARGFQGNFQNNARAAQTPEPGRKAPFAGDGVPQPPNRGGQGFQNYFQNNTRYAKTPGAERKVPFAGDGSVKEDILSYICNRISDQNLAMRLKENPFLKAGTANINAPFPEVIRNKLDTIVRNINNLPANTDFFAANTGIYSNSQLKIDLNSIRKEYKELNPTNLSY